MERTRVNVTVGLFVLIGVLALGYLSVNLGRVSFLGGGGYVVSAEFPSVGGLKPGSTVEIAGVEIGRVESITLKDYQAIASSCSLTLELIRTDRRSSSRPAGGSERSKRRSTSRSCCPSTSSARSRRTSMEIGRAHV